MLPTMGSNLQPVRRASKNPFFMVLIKRNTRNDVKDPYAKCLQCSTDQTAHSQSDQGPHSLLIESMDTVTYIMNGYCR